MADLHWTSYVAVATGSIGAITGIAGAIMGYLGYRRSTEIKALDLRLELRRAGNQVNADLKKLEELLPRADKSRRHVASATGARDSGAMVAWSRQVDSDTERLVVLTGREPSPLKDYADLSPRELENKLVEVHRLQSEMTELLDRYTGALQADDEQRKQIREDFRAMQDRAR